VLDMPFTGGSWDRTGLNIVTLGSHPGYLRVVHIDPAEYLDAAGGVFP
jgi:hypothetical protein